MFEGLGNDFSRVVIILCEDGSEGVGTALTAAAGGIKLGEAISLARRNDQQERGKC